MAHQCAIIAQVHMLVAGASGTNYIYFFFLINLMKITNIIMDLGKKESISFIYLLFI